MNCDWDTYVKQILSPQVALGPDKFIPALESKLRVCKRKKQSYFFKNIEDNNWEMIEEVVGRKGQDSGHC